MLAEGVFVGRDEDCVELTYDDLRVASLATHPRAALLQRRLVVAINSAESTIAERLRHALRTNGAGLTAGLRVKLHMLLTVYGSDLEREFARLTSGWTDAPEALAGVLADLAQILRHMRPLTVEEMEARRTAGCA